MQWVVVAASEERDGMPVDSKEYDNARKIVLRTFCDSGVFFAVKKGIGIF